MFGNFVSLVPIRISSHVLFLESYARKDLKTSWWCRCNCRWRRQRSCAWRFRHPIYGQSVCQALARVNSATTSEMMMTAWRLVILKCFWQSRFNLARKSIKTLLWWCAAPFDVAVDSVMLHFWWHSNQCCHTCWEAAWGIMNGCTEFQVSKCWRA